MRKNWIFDCDGVLLNSNQAKCEAMYDAAKPFGESEARALVMYHKERGGIGREIKFRYFFETILHREGDFSQDYDDLMVRYSRFVQNALADCEVAPALDELMSLLKTVGIQSFVISGAEQGELRNLLHTKKIERYFKGVFGSPRTKPQWMKYIADQHGPIQVCIGDSHHDYDVAVNSGAQFVFMSAWSEWEQGLSFFRDNNAVTVLEHTRSLLGLLKENPDMLGQPTTSQAS